MSVAAGIYFAEKRDAADSAEQHPDGGFLGAAGRNLPDGGAEKEYAGSDGGLPRGNTGDGWLSIALNYGRARGDCGCDETRSLGGKRNGKWRQARGWFT